MRNHIAAVMTATSLVIGTAYAQVPTKSDVDAVTDSAINMATRPKSTAENTEMTNDERVGALKECYDTIGDKPRTTLQSCLERKTHEVTSQMYIAYKKLEAKTKEIDTNATTKALTSLLASQKAFETFKDAQCQWEGDSMLGGSGSGDILSACKVDLIRWRTKQLSD